MWNKQRFSYLHHIPPAKLRTIFETTKFFSENLSDGIRAEYDVIFIHLPLKNCWFDSFAFIN